MSTIDRYVLACKGIFTALRILGMTVITRKDVAKAWNTLGAIAGNLDTIPGPTMTAAMKEAGVALGGKYKDDGKDAQGKAINPRIEF